MRDPIWVYDNWSAYTDGLHGLDTTRLDERLAMRELDEIRRLQALGVRFDYYMMNGFWFAPDGAYRKWREADWPNGPDRWIAACHQAGLEPGLWFGTNSMWKIEPAPQWRSSLAVKPQTWWAMDAMSLHEGGFLSDFMDVLQYWYDHGIRMFELDAANFDAATPAAQASADSQETRRRNETALRDALQAFRRRNPDAMLVAFNGFGGDIEHTASDFPFKNPVDLRWLEVFDTLYCGDTRASDVPDVSFWRSVDLYNDHMVRRYEQSGVPLERIDPFFTLSTTWFGYQRGKQAWKAMLLLTAARGTWKKTIYGSLELLSDDDARWFARVQEVFTPLLALGRTKTFGGIPGEAEPYGFASMDSGGAIYTVVNPAQERRAVSLPQLSRVQEPPQHGRLLFHDAGFTPLLRDSTIVLGAGQMAVIGFDRYADEKYDLGIEQDIVIPTEIRPLDASFSARGGNTIEATIHAPPAGDLRIIFQQRSVDGAVLKSPQFDDQQSLQEARALLTLRIGQLMKIEACHDGKQIPVEAYQADKMAILGISWGAGEIRRKWLTPGRPLVIRCSSAEARSAVLTGRIYIVEYQNQP